MQLLGLREARTLHVYQINHQINYVSPSCMQLHVCLKCQDMKYSVTKRKRQHLHAVRYRTKIIGKIICQEAGSGVDRHRQDFLLDGKDAGGSMQMHVECRHFHSGLVPSLLYAYAIA